MNVSNEDFALNGLRDSAGVAVLSGIGKSGSTVG